MMNFKKLSTAVAVTAALGAGAAGPAHADAFSEAMILISNFVFTNGSGTTLSTADFTTLNITDSLTNNAILGVASASSTTQTSGFVASTDAAQACVGSCTRPENTFVVDTPPLAGTSFARADSVLSGASVTNPTIPTGTTANNVAETWINTATTGSDFSDMILSSSFSFVLAHPIGTLGIQFTGSSFDRAWTSAGSAPGTLAGSNINFSIVLSDSNGTILSWTPGGAPSQGLTVIAEGCDLNDQRSVPNNSPSAAFLQCTNGAFSANSAVALAAGTQYSVTITQHVATNATSVAVPEPATLALLGMGLAGLGFARRKWWV